MNLRIKEEKKRRKFHPGNDSDINQNNSGLHDEDLMYT